LNPSWRPRLKSWAEYQVVRLRGRGILFYSWGKFDLPVMGDGHGKGEPRLNEKSINHAGNLSVNYQFFLSKK
jgi:hypothetical protein